MNRQKIGIRRPSNFELLGHGFVPTYRKGEKATYQLVIKENSWGNLKRKLKDITRKTLPYSFDERLQKLSQVWKGWVNNYCLASIHGKLKTMDEWLRNRLRHCVWHDCPEGIPLGEETREKAEKPHKVGIIKGMAYA